MKLLFVAGDMTSFLSRKHSLTKEITAQGAALHIAASFDEEADEKDGIAFHSLPANGNMLDPRPPILRAWKIFRIMQNVKPDMVHAFSLRDSVVTAIAAHMLRTPRAVFNVTGIGALIDADNPYKKAARRITVPLLRFLLGGEGRILVFQTTAEAKRILRAGIVKKEQCAVIRGTGVDLSAFPYKAEIYAQEPVILLPLQAGQEKAINIFVHAARIIRSKGIKARFVIAGLTENAKAGQFEDWKEEGAVEFFDGSAEMLSLLQDAHIVTMPHAQGWAIPETLVEAAATGRAIVAADTPACREVVEDGVSGYLVETSGAWGLADAIEKLVADPLIRQAMGAKARKRMEEGFVSAVLDARTMAVYARLFPRKEKAALKQAA